MVSTAQDTGSFYSLKISREKRIGGCSCRIIYHTREGEADTGSRDHCRPVNVFLKLGNIYAFRHIGNGDARHDFSPLMDASARKRMVISSFTES